MTDDRPVSVKAPSCSVIVPCHNEEGGIIECLRRIPSVGSRTEIIVVDDGSTDDTRRRVEQQEARDLRVRLVRLDRNQGKAAATRAGFEAASGDVLLVLDADMAVPPEDIAAFFAPLAEGKADFVNGTRLVHPIPREDMGLARFWGNKAFCGLMSLLLGRRVTDTLCGTKAFFKKDYRRMPALRGDRWGDFDLLFGAALLELRVAEVPVRYQGRRTGASKMRVLRDGLAMLGTCWRGWRLLRSRTAP